MDKFGKKYDADIAQDGHETGEYAQEIDETLLVNSVNKKILEVHNKIFKQSEMLGLTAVMQEVLLEQEAKFSTYELAENARQLGKLEGLLEAYNTFKYDPKIDTF